MKSFKTYILESEDYDPRADINVPYKTPRDIHAIMTGQSIPQTKSEDSDEFEKEKREKKREIENKKSSIKGKESTKKRRRERQREGELGFSTYRDIAKQLGVHHSTIENLENSALDKLAAGLASLKKDPGMLQAWYDVNRPSTKGMKKASGSDY